MKVVWYLLGWSSGRARHKTITIKLLQRTGNVGFASTLEWNIALDLKAVRASTLNAVRLLGGA